MPVNDEIREQRQKLKGKGFKYKFQYFWEYYRWPTLAVIIIIIFLYSMIKNFVTAKDTAFQALFINSSGAIDSEEFSQLIGIDTKKEEVIFDGSYTLNLNSDTYDEASYVNMQKVLAMASAKQLDVILSYKDMLEYYGKGEMLTDLRTFFGEEWVEEMGDKVVWVDIEEDESDELVPVAVNVTDAKKLAEAGCFPYGDCYFGIIGNTPHEDWVKVFYDYIYK